MRTPQRRQGTWLIAVPLLMAAVGLPGPVAAQEETAAEAADSMTVELVIATAVEDREPVGAADTFPADVGQLFAWLRVTDGTGEAIQVVWIHGDVEVPVALQVGGSPWRTWSSKEIPADATGEWTVEVRDADGNVVESTAFTVEAAGDSPGG